MTKTISFPLMALALVLVVPAQQESPSQAPTQQARPNPIPDPPYKNLQVLPKDISKPELVQTMRTFSIQLGVRCGHCHVANDDLSIADFPSDEKPAKTKARVMIRMLDTINGQHLTRLESGGSQVSRATCWTCHREQSKPEEWKMPERLKQ